MKRSPLELGHSYFMSVCEDMPNMSFGTRIWRMVPALTLLFVSGFAYYWHLLVKNRYPGQATVMWLVAIGCLPVAVYWYLKTPALADG